MPSNLWDNSQDWKRSMKKISVFLIGAAMAASVSVAITFAAVDVDDKSSAILGIEMPQGYRDWGLISVAHEEGKLNDLRAILGNDVAIKDFREGKLQYPDGTIIARLA
jgi:hypothetical protein